MPTARISTGRQFNTSNVYARGKHPRVTIYQVKSPYLYLTFPFAPVEVDYGDRSNEYVEIERVGRTGLLAYKRNKLKTIQFTALLADRSQPGIGNVENKLKTLEALAAQTVDLHIVGYGPSIDPKMNFRITDMSYSSTYRAFGSNKITKAQVNLQLTQAPRFVSDVPGMEKILYEYRSPTTPGTRATSGTGSDNSNPCIQQTANKPCEGK
jgi:hypothetical protein